MQLYVSVDAATKDSLKAIDRPLFADFWERFLVSSPSSPLSCRFSELGFIGINENEKKLIL